jgi:dihydrofolate reductase
MGRKTWDSLPAKYRPLPNRLNVVLTSNNQVVFPEGVKVFRSFDEALYCLSKDDRLGKLFVIGGANVFSQAIIHPACSELYLTQIDQSFPCDVFFPPIPSNLKKDQSSDFFEETGVKFQFIHFTAM